MKYQTINTKRCAPKNYAEPRPRNCKRSHIVQVIAKNHFEGSPQHFGIQILPSLYRRPPAGRFFEKWTSKNTQVQGAYFWEVPGSQVSLSASNWSQNGNKWEPSCTIRRIVPVGPCWSLLPRKWWQALQLRPLLHTRRGPG